ncbi:MAG: hypothetical protein KAI26_01340 [Nanoarchaeota archaeon]|nr:hypothetical protein [Nanoarchaeota archaeon]
MRKIILGIIIISILVLSGCSSKTCPEIECPELDCSACPPKIEYQEKIVEKEMEVIKYQCYDGTFKSSSSKCASPEEVKLSRLEEGKHATINIDRVQVQLANLYPTRVTVENTGRIAINPKFDVVVKKGTTTVCSASPLFDEFRRIEPGEKQTGEFQIMGCIFNSDGQYTITIDLLDSDYNKLDTDTETFNVDYWGMFS